MKKLYIKALAALMLAGSFTSCGDDFLDAKIYSGIDMDTALNSVDNIGYAVNGCYDRLYRYYFAGNYATMFGDIASDISYWNGKTNHFNDIYQFSPTPTDNYLYYIWNYGYKVCDNSARVIKAGEEMMATVSEDEKPFLEMYLAEAYALRAYGHLVLVNTFAHQVKVNGADFSATPGIVIIDIPKTSSDKVSRSTVGDTYTQIVNDLKKSVGYFASCGMDKGTRTYFNEASAWGLLARTYLYLENFGEAFTAADNALQLSGISTLATTDAAYKALYNGGASNRESLFYLDINSMYNWSANSCGTLWSTYSYSPSPYFQSIMADTDCRRAVWAWDPTSTPSVPVFKSGKFSCYSTGNPAVGTNYLINAPEMFLIKAESALRKSSPDITAAQDNLLVVAQRNSAITSTGDLPADATGLLSFLQEERARELFQEGHRLWDLRRWDIKANLAAVAAPNIQYTYTNFKVSDCVYPIPVDEINAGFGVTQNENWSSTFPSM